MTKRKYLKPTKLIRFYWRRGHTSTATIYMLNAEMDGRVYDNVTQIWRLCGHKTWENCLDDEIFSTAKAAREHVEKLLGLEE